MQYFHLQMQVQNGFILIKMILRVGQRLRVLWKTGYPFFVAKHTTKRSGGPFLVTFIRDIRHYTESALHHPHFQSYGFFP